MTSTKNGIPWEIERHEEFETRTEAIKKENKIKLRGIRRYLDSTQM
jgi:predicted GIY-YIG superfamily endonuclease